jgi:dienelactone hydrolase
MTKEKHFLMVGLVLMCQILWALAITADNSNVLLSITHIEKVAYTTPPQEAAYGPEELDIYAPVDPGPWPVVVLLHGMGGGRISLRRSSRILAEQGSVVITPTWRTHYPARAARNDGEEAAQSIGDITCAIRFARGKAADYGGDPTRVTLVGYSGGGGYGMIVALGGEAPFRALVGERSSEACVVHEPSDPPEAFVGVAGPYDFFDSKKGGIPIDLKAENPELWEQISSYALIGKRSNSNLRIHLFHGEQDVAPPAEVSIKTHNALQRAGYESNVTIVPNMGHWFILTGPDGELILETIKEVMRH